MKVCRMGLPLVDFFDLRRTTDTKKFPRLNEAKITNDNFLFKNDNVLLIYPISKVLGSFHRLSSNDACPFQVLIKPN